MEKKRNVKSEARNRLIFYILGMTVPLIQFIIFYFVVNANGFLLSFQKYEMYGNNAGTYVFNGLNTFRDVIMDFVNLKYLRDGIWRGLLSWLLNQAFFWLSTFLAYYIAKGFRLSRTYQVILMLPGIVSSLVMMVTYKFFVCECIPALWEDITGNSIPSLLDTGETRTTLIVIIFYYCYSIFGSNILLLTSVFSDVSFDIREAAQLDGITPFREFWLVFLPICWPTVSTFVILSLNSLLSSGYGLYPFYGEYAPTDTYTLGYYITMRTQTGDLKDYPYLAALGNLISVITIPIALFVRSFSKKLEKKYN